MGIRLTDNVISLDETRQRRLQAELEAIRQEGLDIERSYAIRQEAIERLMARIQDDYRMLQKLRGW